MTRRPDDERADRAAVAWYVRLGGAIPGDAEHRSFDRWHAAHPTHRDAWRRMTATEAQLDRVGSEPALRALVERAKQARPQRHRAARFWIALAATTFLAVAGGMLTYRGTHACHGIGVDASRLRA